VLAPGTKCKFLAWSALRPSTGGSLVQITAATLALDAKIEDDAGLARRVESWKRRLGDAIPAAAGAAGHPAGSTAAPGH
jgi:hypothetical protein